MPSHLRERKVDVPGREIPATARSFDPSDGLRLSPEMQVRSDAHLLQKAQRNLAEERDRRRSRIDDRRR